MKKDCFKRKNHRKVGKTLNKTLDSFFANFAPWRLGGEKTFETASFKEEYYFSF